MWWTLFFISLLGTESLAAIGFTFPVTFTVISLTIGLGIGTSAVIARKLGADKERQARHVGSSALYMAAILVAALALLGFLLAEPIFSLLGAQPELMPLIMNYMNIWFAGAVLLVIPMIGNSVLRASGDTKTPSIIMGLGGVLNAIFDPILIFGLGPIPALGMQGAALASVLSWSIGFGLIIYWLVVRKKLIDARPPSMKVFLASSKRLLAIGLPAAGANMLTPLSMAVMTAIVATHGAAAVAGFGAGIRLESLASIIILALSMSLPPFISQNFGAGKLDRVRAAYKTALLSVLVIQALIYIALVSLLPLIQLAFAREEAVADVLALFIWIMPLSYGLQGWIILTNSSMNALHLPLRALLLSALRLFVFFVPLSYLGSQLAGLQGLFIGGAVANVITASLSYRWFMKILDAKEAAASSKQQVAGVNYGA
jgi:putative MATE family efflux protein